MRVKRQRRRSRFTLGPAPAAPPVHVEFDRNPRAGILFDVDTGEVLWERHPDRRLPIASLTKMITGAADRRAPPPRRDGRDHAARRSPTRARGWACCRRARRCGSRALLKGLLLVSGNDAAIALAQHDAGSVDDFVERMNRRRRRLGLRCSHFTSPHGLQDEGNYSCPRDLATLARADLAERARRARSSAPTTPASRSRSRAATSTSTTTTRSSATGPPGSPGVKTGYTDAAGRCYVTTASTRGRHLGVVLLDSPNPLEQVPALLRAGFNEER